MKHWLFVLSSIMSFLILLLYLIEILSSDGSPFEIIPFIKSFVTSFPFLILIAFIDYRLVLYVNNSPYFSRHMLIRIFLEIVCLVVFAVMFVIIGNIPFYGKVENYVNSEGYLQSVIAAILINIFTVIIMEYFVQIRKNQELIQENLRIQYRELKSQINPHFLFNSLNILVSLINKDSSQAIRCTKKLSEVYRYVLSSGEDNVIRLKDEVRFITDYIEILQIRFGKGLQVSFDIEESDLQHQIVPMALQVLIENAVKHNVVSPATPLSINISSDGRQLTVSNNIIPRKNVEPCTGIGIKNLEKKYGIISDRNIEIIKDEQCFKVRLPLL